MLFYSDIPFCSSREDPGGGEGGGEAGREVGGYYGGGEGGVMVVMVETGKHCY